MNIGGAEVTRDGSATNGGTDREGGRHEQTGQELLAHLHWVIPPENTDMSFGSGKPRVGSLVREEGVFPEWRGLYPPSIGNAVFLPV
jgi:hypothetical protein